MSPIYRCTHGHDEVRWAWVGGQYCWVCGAVGRPAVAMTITAIDAFIRDLDDDLAPEPVDAHHLILPPAS